MEIVKRDGSKEELDIKKMRKVIQFACADFPECDPNELEMDAQLQFRNEMTTREIQRVIIRAAVEKTTIQVPNWQFVAARLLAYDLYKEAGLNRGHKDFGYGSFYGLINALTESDLYGEYILENYSEEDILELEHFIKPQRDDLFHYAGLQLFSDRYIVRGYNKQVLELPQERFMMIAMHLAIPEQDKIKWAKEFYEVLSKLEMTVATPTLANAGRRHYQLSSCFIDTVPDSLWGIYNTDASFAQVSKHGGGMGIYVGKIRSESSAIRGVKGAAGGVIPWVKNYNNTALAVDQLGVRSGAVAIYLDIWHKDILDFLNIKTNNGDDRKKAHDVFPGVCIPDLFMEAVEARASWYLFDPNEVRELMGWSLEDSFDDVYAGSKEFTARYNACVSNPLISKTEVPAIEIMKRIMTSGFETGTPFIFYRDTVNAANPNKHAGMIYCSNLCTEICQPMKPSELISEVLEDGIITVKVKSGDFVVCNLNSLNLGRVYSFEDIDRIVPTQMRMLDNVIDLNFYPIPQAEFTNKKYRSVGLGTSGLHQHLAQKKIQWESDEHVAYGDKLYEHINHVAITASMEIAAEKGSYSMFEGSEWQTGVYFERRDYDSPEWLQLKAKVARHGVRNAHLFAIAPTASTSLFSNSTAGVDPVFSKFFIEEKRDGLIPQTAPNLTAETMWYYKEANLIDQQWTIKAAGARQRHIDQAQSVNFYVTPEISSRELLDLYVQAWKQGMKTIYYIRNKSLKPEECVSCSA